MSYAAVPGWLKSLRLHKYMGVFSQLTYEEMLSLTDDDLIRLGVSAMVWIAPATLLYPAFALY